MKKVLFLFFISLIFISVVYFYGNFFYSVKGGIYKIVSGVSNGLESGFKMIFSIRDVYNENDLFKKELRRLTAENSRIKDLEEENKALKLALNFDAERNYKKISAYILGREQSLFEDIFILNEGMNSKIFKGAPVVNYSGELIGIIDSVDKDFSRVRSLTDKSFVLGAEINGNVKGVVKGALEGVIMDFILPDKDVAAGDPVTASEFGQMMFKSLPIGIVDSILSLPSDSIKKVKIKSFADLNDIDFVFVLISPNSRR